MHVGKLSTTEPHHSTEWPKGEKATSDQLLKIHLVKKQKECLVVSAVGIVLCFAPVDTACFSLAPPCYQ